MTACAPMNKNAGQDGLINLSIGALGDPPALRRPREILHRLAATTCGRTGQDFFNTLVASLAEVLEVDHALIGELTADGQSIRTLSYWSGEKLLPATDYPLSGTPCERVVRGEICFYPAEVQRHFPRAVTLRELNIESYLGIPLFDSRGRQLGLLALFHSRPLTQWDEVPSILKIFAARAAAELERLQTEAVLRANEQRFRSLIDCGFDLIVELDAEGTICFASPSVRRILGLDPAEAEGRSVFEFLHPEDRPQAREVFTAQPSRVGKGIPVEMRVLHRDGSWRTLAGVSNFLPGNPGQPLHLVLNCRDITESRRTECQLRHAQRLDSIGTVASGFAHELKNLLMPMVAHACMLRDDLAASEQAQMSLGEIIKCGERANTLLQQILTFSRREESHCSPVDLRDTVASAARLLRASIPSTVRLSVHLPAGPAPAVADTLQIQQVMLNLGINAWQAMPGGAGHLQVTLVDYLLGPVTPPPAAGMQPGQYLRLTFRDDGDGMDEALITRIFEPFFTTKPVGQGTGLGLAVVHGIMRSHRGAIAVESKPGEGTTMHLYFPRRASNS